MNDPRYSPGMALSFHLDPTPGRHTAGGTGEMEFFTGADILPLPEPLNVHKRDYAHKGPAHRFLVNDRQMMNAAGLCIFSAFIAPPDALVRELTFVTGEPWDIGRVQLTGERIQTLRHAFNLREGLNPIKDFRVPQRCLDGTELKSGMGKGYVVDLDAMRDSYLETVGWDKETTFPSAEGLRALGLEDLIPDLYPQEAAS
ncbi:MAG: aldehyde ferredoxin oxidoreductase C-terminal domain-containing protein [Coriobacteriales bacterium]